IGGFLIGSRSTTYILTGPGDLFRPSLAKITVKDWPGLLEWCKKFKTRIDAGPRMLAFEALALDKLGHTQKAKELLENMLAGGVLDSLALNTYVTITVRCGYVQEAIDAAEKIMEAATSKRQQMDCIRLLFNLIQQSDHGSQRLLALAVQMGRLADQDSEIEESSYLIMFLMATPREDQVPTQPELAEFRQRCDAFFVKFPESKILKRGVFRENSSGSELIEQIKGFIGVSEDREAFQRRIENQLQLGLAVVPFSWRPNLVLSYIHDTVHLWEIAKTSSIDDKKYHLTMLNDAEWTPPSAASVSDRTPLLDLTALLVLFDLALIDTAIRFFGSIAIAKATLERLASLVSPFSGSPSRSKCVALQDALKPHFGSIIQPSVSKLAEEDSDENRVFGRELREITQLCQQDDSYRLYSDDLFFRIFVAQGSKPDGICTLDALAGFEQAGLLTRQDAARKISMLCRWHVGLLVQFDDLVALLPLELSEVSTVRQGIELLDQHSDFTAVIDAIWDFRAPFNKTLDHAAAVLRRLIEETTLSNSALASLIGLWFVKAGLKSDAPQNPLRILTKAITRAALSPNLTEAASSKLWNVYAQLVEFHHGALMDVRKEREAVGLLGAECAKLQTTDAELGQTIQSALRLGLTEGTSTDADFMAGFSTALVRIGTQTNQARR
ncbi:hypothetical protein, partial [Castellaniella sp. GW247-6E4]|uniref:hypothetical protein n=1 Tax=Castellaniella sp. GW247-6E4 TaxID=3140380 RepID=UPI0033161C6D